MDASGQGEDGQIKFAAPNDTHPSLSLPWPGLLKLENPMAELPGPLQDEGYKLMAA